MKKRKLAALLTACMLLLSSFAGCAQTTEEQSAQTQEQTTAETAEEPAQEESEAETTEEVSAHEGEWTFTDSLGRTVTLEGELTRVAPSGNLAQQCLFSVAPEKMVGLGSDLGETAAKYYGEIADLPVFGAFYGSKANLNREALLAADPQIVIDIGEVKDDMAQELDQLQEQIGIPVVLIEASLVSTGDAFRTLGELLDCQEQANKIADYCDQAVSEAQENAASIPEEERKSVYYGLYEDGLTTCAQGSFHTEVIDLVGAVNCAEMENAGSGFTEISFEQLLNWQPDVVLLDTQSMVDAAPTDALWKELTAVQNGQVYKIPTEPYSFLDQPPAANRIIGIKWLGNLLYPEVYDYDMVKEVQDFYQLFYRYELSDQEAQELLGQ